jgi:hypothetical protein
LTNELDYNDLFNYLSNWIANQVEQKTNTFCQNSQQVLFYWDVYSNWTKQNDIFGQNGC